MITVLKLKKIKNKVLFKRFHRFHNHDQILRIFRNKVAVVVILVHGIDDQKEVDHCPMNFVLDNRPYHVDRILHTCHLENNTKE
jgi:hypothetical protein